MFRFTLKKWDVDWFVPAEPQHEDVIMLYYCLTTNQMLGTNIYATLALLWTALYAETIDITVKDIASLFNCDHKELHNTMLYYAFHFSNVFVPTDEVFIYHQQKLFEQIETETALKMLTSYGVVPKSLVLSQQVEQARHPLSQHCACAAQPPVVMHSSVPKSKSRARNSGKAQCRLHTPSVHDTRAVPPARLPRVFQSAQPAIPEVQMELLPFSSSENESSHAESAEAMMHHQSSCDVVGPQSNLDSSRSQGTHILPVSRRKRLAMETALQV
jgi:hypothetical protein